MGRKPLPPRPTPLLLCLQMLLRTSCAHKAQLNRRSSVQVKRHQKASSTPNAKPAPAPSEQFPAHSSGDPAGPGLQPAPPALPSRRQAKSHERQTRLRKPGWQQLKTKSHSMPTSHPTHSGRSCLERLQGTGPCSTTAQWARPKTRFPSKLCRKEKVFLVNLRKLSPHPGVTVQESEKPRGKDPVALRQRALPPLACVWTVGAGKAGRRGS